MKIKTFFRILTLGFAFFTLTVFFVNCGEGFQVEKYQGSMSTPSSGNNESSIPETTQTPNTNETNTPPSNVTPIPGNQPTTSNPVTTVPPPTPGARSGFVTRSGKNLMLDGKIFRFVGVNDFSLTGCHYGVVPTDAQLDYFFKNLRPRSVTRTWAFSVSNQTAIERVVRYAEKYNQKVMLSLGEGAGYCGASSNNAEFFRSGFRGAYFDHIRRIVPKFKDSPAIIWEIMNEPGLNGGGTQAEMKRFYHESAELIKTLDANHLVATGTLDSYQSFQFGQAGYADVHNSPYIDMVSMHEYEYDYSGNTGVASRFNQNKSAAHSLNKPIYVGEYGCARTSEKTDPQKRAQVAIQKMDAYLANEAAGALYWTFTLPPNTTSNAGGPAANEAWDSPVASTIRNYKNSLLDP